MGPAPFRVPPSALRRAWGLTGKRLTLVTLSASVCCDDDGGDGAGDGAGDGEGRVAPIRRVAAAARGEAELRHGLQTSWFPVRAHNFQSDLKTREFAESVF